MINVCIVIPYFQRATGVLRRTLTSVAHQSYNGPVTLCIVDDSSPIPAREELLGISFSPNINVEIIEQENGGPANARNAGLDYAENHDFNYLAFLDSDDAWDPEHVDRAITALESGFDLYFSDFIQLEQNHSVFNNSEALTRIPHKALKEGSDLYSYEGDFYDQIISDYILGTSTIVYRLNKFKGQRFNEAFINAGEDHLFWLDMAIKKPSVCFSSQIEAIYGNGVNVWASGGWGKENRFRVLYFEIKFNNKLLLDYPLSKQQRTHIVHRRRKKMCAVLQDLIHRMTNRKKINWKLLRLFISENRRFPIMLPYFATRILVDHFRN